MSLLDLAKKFREQAASGFFEISSKTLTEKTELILPEGLDLDSLISDSFKMKSSENLTVDVKGPGDIPDPIDDHTLVIDKGTVTFKGLKLEKLNSSIVFTTKKTGDKEIVNFTLQTILGSDWKFSNSFRFMSGFPYDKLPYTEPSFIFSTDDKTIFKWNNLDISLKKGQNFASELTLSLVLEHVIGLISSDPVKPLTFFGPIDVKDVGQKPIVLPDISLDAKIPAKPVPILLLKLSEPRIGLQIETITSKEKDEVEKYQQQRLFFGLQLNIGEKIEVDFQALIDQYTKSNFYIAITSPPGKEITPAQLFNLVGGADWYSLIPSELIQFLGSIALKGLVVDVSTGDSLSINAIGVLVGSTKPWKLFDQFQINSFDVQWEIFDPGGENEMEGLFTAEFDFFRDELFHGPFEITITSDLQIDGNFEGEVKFTDIVRVISNGIVNIPENESFIKFTFTYFDVYLDFKQKIYCLGAEAEASLDILGTKVIELENIRFELGVYPKTGSETGKDYKGLIQGDLYFAGLGIFLSAEYGGEEKGWTFQGKMLPNEELKLGDMINQLMAAVKLPEFLPGNTLVIKDVEIMASPASGKKTKSSYSARGSLQLLDTHLGFLGKFSLSANFSITYEKDEKKTVTKGSFYFVETIEAIGAKFEIGYKFNTEASNILFLKWEGIGDIKYDITKSIITVQVGDWSFGTAIAALMKMIGLPDFELVAPWSILNDISLKGFEITFDLKNKKVEFIYNLPQTIDLGFIKIEGLTLKKDGEKVKLAIKGSTIIPHTGDEKWDNLFDPKKGQDVKDPPDVTGLSKYFDLKLLAMGQHVSFISGKTTTMDEAIQTMEKSFKQPDEEKKYIIPIGKDATAPNLEFKSASHWLFATHFGILWDKPAKAYTVDIAVIFNDPELYGLKLKMAGEKASVFKGLEFEILYKKITDTIGMYKTEITLPDKIRDLSFEVVSIILPVVGIEIYTNGNFKVDIGFPYNLDFSRSCSLFVVVDVGVPIPLAGSGGFYFGALNGATSSQVPKTTKGQFNPVIEFGLGLRFGLGYNYSQDQFKVGFTLTIFGIIEGVIAAFTPYSSAKQDANDFFFKLKGTLGVMGEIYARIDVSVVKASFSAKIYLACQAEYEAYRQLVLAIMGGIEVSLKVKVELGVLSIDIDFSFNFTFKEELKIGEDKVAPWENVSQLKSPADRGSLEYRGPGPLVKMDFKPLKVDVKEELNLLFLPGLTASNEWNQDKQRPEYVAMLFIDSPKIHKTKFLKNNEDRTSFEYLVEGVLCWVINASFIPEGKNINGAGLGQEAVSLERLQAVYKYLSENPSPTPIPRDKIIEFLKNYFNINIKGPHGHTQKQINEINTGNYTVFPLFPTLTLKTFSPDNSIETNIDVEFDKYTQCEPGYLETIEEYFKELEVEIKNELEEYFKDNNTLAVDEARETKTQSVASFIFQDYFLLVAKNMVQRALDAMKNFTYELIPGKENSLNYIVQQINAIKSGDKGNNLTPEKLVEANASFLLNKDKKITIIGILHTIEKNVTTGENDTFSSIAKQYASSLEVIARQNKEVSGIFIVGVVIIIDSKPYTVQKNDTLQIIANFFSKTPGQLIKYIQTQKDLLKPGRFIIIAGTKHQVKSSAGESQSLADIANLYRTTTKELGIQNQCTPDLLKVGTKIEDLDYIVKSGDTLEKIAKKQGKSIEDIISAIKNQKNLPQPLTEMQIPPFTYTTEGKNDTFKTIANKYNVSIKSLALNSNNRKLPEIFAADKHPYLNIPGLQCLYIKDILSDIRKCNAVAHLTGMTARYHLHGLRLPINDLIEFQHGKIFPWQQEKDAGLFRMTGQQFPLPDLKEGDLYSIVLEKGENLDWITFGPTGPTGANELKITLDNKDIEKIQGVQKASAAPEVESLEQMPVYQTEAGKFVFKNVMPWQSPGKIKLPNEFGACSLENESTPYIRNFPSSLSRQLSKEKEIAPAFSAQIGSNVNAGPVYNYSPSKCYGWSTLIDFNIKKIVSGDTQTGSDPGNINPFAYELVGADENGILLLERLLTSLWTSPGQPVKIDRMRLLYRPNQTGQNNEGLLSDEDANIVSFITQTNLSTETNPPEMLFMQGFKDDQSKLKGILAPEDFIRHLWECSIVRSGGFYLYYQNGKSGFPDYIFDKNGTAEICLLITYDTPKVTGPTGLQGLAVSEAPGMVPGVTGPTGPDLLGNYMNCLVTGDKPDTDTGKDVVFAESFKQVKYYGLEKNDTLHIISDKFNITLSQLAKLNADKLLNNGFVIKIRNINYVVQPDDIKSESPLSKIAKYFGTTGEEIKKLNKDRGIDFDHLKLWQLLRIPDIDHPVESSDEKRNTLNKIAKYYGISIEGLAFYNSGLDKNKKEIFPVGATGLIHDQIVNKTATVPQGNIGFQCTRPGPTGATGPGGYLENVYNLLSYQVVNNYPDTGLTGIGFTGSVIGLPVGPVNHLGHKEAADRQRKPGKENKRWEYRQVLPIYTFAKYDPLKPDKTDEVLPGPEDNPYKGIGEWAQVHFDWQDTYGNRTLTPFNKPGMNPGQPSNNPAIQVGYTDKLLPFTGWPSVMLDYSSTISNGPPALEVSLKFDPSRYEKPGKNNEIPDVYKDKKEKPEWQKNAIKDRAVYKKIYYQLNQVRMDTDGKYVNDVCITLETTLLEQKGTGIDPWKISDDQFGKIKEFVKQGYIYLDAIAGGGTGTVPDNVAINRLIPPDKINNKEIFELTVFLDIYRNVYLVDDHFKDVPDVMRAETKINPCSQGKNNWNSQNENEKTQSLKYFAREFENTFKTRDYILKIATGVSKESIGGEKKDEDIWVVRFALGKKKGPTGLNNLEMSNGPAGLTGSNGIYIDIKAPAFYAPNPLAKELQTRKDVPIYKYETGGGWVGPTGPTAGLTGPVTPTYKTFSGVDLDLWGKEFLTTVDRFLSPDYANAAFLVDYLNKGRTGPTGPTPPGEEYLPKILEAKKVLADAISTRISPILDRDKGITGGVEDAKEKLKQQLLNKLSNAYDIDAIVRYDVSAASGFTGENSPRLFGKPLAELQTGTEYPGGSAGTTIKRRYSLSTAKVPLAEGPSNLTFLFSTKNVKEHKKIDLDVDYTITHLEHDIHSLGQTGATGLFGDYKASTWLTFVIPPNIADQNNEDNDDPLYKKLGVVKIPILLRALPRPPSLISQKGESHYKKITKWEDAIIWDYQYIYSQEHAAQDTIYTAVQFNIPGGETLEDFYGTDLFVRLAQFVSVYPQIFEDFDKYLKDINIKSGTTSEEYKNALHALETFANLTSAVANAWDNWQKNNARFKTNKNVEEYRFSIGELESSKNLLNIELTQTGATGPIGPTGVFEKTTVDIEGYTSIKIGQEKETKKYKYLDSRGNPLTWKDSLNIPDRQVNIKERNIIGCQNASSSVRLVRNEGLIQGETTNEEFEYRTPTVKFGNKLIPLLCYEDPDGFDISEDKTTTLNEHLESFFGELFKLAYTIPEGIKIKLECKYSFTLKESKDSPEVVLPVLFVPPRDFETPVDKKFIDELSDQIVGKWFTEHQPSTKNGKIIFDLAVFSNLNDNELPILQLEDLFIKWEKIIPS